MDLAGIGGGDFRSALPDKCERRLLHRLRARSSQDRSSFGKRGRERDPDTDWKHEVDQGIQRGNPGARGKGIVTGPGCERRSLGRNGYISLESLRANRLGVERDGR